MLVVCERCGEEYDSDEFPEECPYCSEETLPPRLICRICGALVREGGLREHLEGHNPNARGMSWEDARNTFELAEQ